MNATKEINNGIKTQVETMDNGIYGITVELPDGTDFRLHLETHSTQQPEPCYCDYTLKA